MRRRPRWRWRYRSRRFSERSKGLRLLRVPLGVLLWGTAFAGIPSVECDPGYLTIDPNADRHPSIIVTATAKVGRARVQSAVFPSSARCAEARRLLEAVLPMIPTTAKVTIQTELCESPTPTIP